MRQPETRRRRPAGGLALDLRVILAVTPIGAAAGAMFTWLLYGLPAVQGAFTGAVIGAAWMSFERLLVPRLQRFPFGLALLLRALGLSCTIVLGLGLGIFTFGTSDHPDWFNAESLVSYSRNPNLWIDLAFSFAVGSILTFLSAVNLLIGPGVLAQVLLGRYYRPRVEDRIFLFADLMGSTALAERLGALRFHALLQQVFADLSPPVVRARGRIDRYIGDSVVVTWPLRRGKTADAALRCCFEMREQLAGQAELYMTRFNCLPSIRVGLHAGPVVAGEVGVFKKEILFLGDTVNTAARVEEACRTFGKPLLITREVLQRLQHPARWRIESLGPFQPRGRLRPTEIFTAEPA